MNMAENDRGVVEIYYNIIWGGVLPDSSLFKQEGDFLPGSFKQRKVFGGSRSKLYFKDVSK